MTERIDAITKPLLLTLLLGLATSASLSAAGPPDPDAMARQPLPEHQQDASHRGKSAMEHAEVLVAPSLVQRLMGLERLGEMGVDGLPARDAVRYVLERGDTEGLASRQVDQLRLAALKTLFELQAPEAEALLRQAILSPAFSQHSSTYRRLVTGAVELGVDEATLQADLLALVDEDGIHAARLMATEALPETVLHSLAEALFHDEHDETATRFFLPRMAEFDFVDEATWLEYVSEHAGLARENLADVQAALAGIGTGDALDVALEVDDFPGRRGELFERFARGPLGPEPVFARLLDELRDEIAQKESAQLAALMENLSGELAAGAAGPGTSPMAEVARRSYIEAMTTLVEQGPSDDHRLVGLQRLVRYQQRHPQTSPAMTLGPVFDTLERHDTSELVMRQATSSLQLSPARLAESDPAFFSRRAVALLWAAESAAHAELPERLLQPLMRSATHAPLVVDTIVESIDEHRDSWAVNPAVGVLMTSGQTRGLERSMARELASQEMGRILVNPVADFAHIGDHFLRNRGGGALANLEYNTVNGLIGILEPTIFDAGSGWQAPFPPSALADIMTARPGWLSREPQAEAEWIAFLRRVRDHGDPDFSPVAEAALDAF